MVNWMYFCVSLLKIHFSYENILRLLTLNFLLTCTIISDLSKKQQQDLPDADNAPTHHAMRPFSCCNARQKFIGIDLWPPNLNPVNYKIWGVIFTLLYVPGSAETKASSELKASKF